MDSGGCCNKEAPGDAVLQALDRRAESIVGRVEEDTRWNVAPEGVEPVDDVERCSRVVELGAEEEDLVANGGGDAARVPFVSLSSQP